MFEELYRVEGYRFVHRDEATPTCLRPWVEGSLVGNLGKGSGLTNSGLCITGADGIVLS